ncbi:DUF4097 family beta strand repeat-containing protein [Bacillus sp. FJAT-22090]|uniref:DUF4097 family beta strand repeat-containing protein n=1 Tax=Bacillus sp. FJAT-22090 TaxID=1581038 RepID=UPI00164244F6|nr:DUF4097 family beta strand repeat-containing protein [Bacillus sp. FJAT-22090]
MGPKKIAIICLFVLLAGAAISVFFNIKDKMVDKSDEIVLNDKNYSNIEVITDNASVDILPTKEAKTKVEFSGKMKKKFKYNFQANIKGDTLYVELKEKRWSFISFGFNSHNMKLIVYVPEKEYNIIKTELDNGQIKIQNIKVQEIDLETDNGMIDLKNIAAKNVQANSDNGQIRMEDVDGTINVETDNGRIIFASPNLNRSISLETDNGAIEVQTDKEPTNATIKVKVDNGKIDVFGTENSQSIFGKGDNLIFLKTDNGKVTVKTK